MAIKIRLTRVGRKNQPVYRIVVAETRSKRDGKNIAKLGVYNPCFKPPVLMLNQAKFKEWIEKGALVSEGVRKILAGQKKGISK